MTESDLQLVRDLPALAFQAMLVFARIGAAAMLLPGLGEQEIPARIRLSLALAITAALLPGLPSAPDDTAEAARLVAQEVVAGLWFGGLARLAALALAIAGQAIAALIGLQGMMVSDPEIGGQATAMARAFGLVSAVLVLGTGLHAVALRALADTYVVLPAGAPLPLGTVAGSVAQAGAASLSLALRLAAPFVIAAVVLNIALGLLSRLVPQVQTFFVVVPGQILAGLALLALLAPAMLLTYGAALSQAFMALPGAR
ncbi:flagellar biosynthetic protein FliR [Falsiroseomonas sp. HW251]|uniref:flagellar biosynthetic protein FliR n=1 Tax=Falsiroseomonas sp. HW251 TaxID=3390998 RepID=UPI003D31C3D7